MLLYLHNHRSTCLSRKVNARLKGPFRLAMDRKMSSMTGDHGLTASNSSSSATYLTALSGPHSFPNTPFPAFSPPLLGLEGVPRIFPTVSDFIAVFKDLSATSSRLLGPYCPDGQVQETIFSPFLELRIIVLICLLDTRQMI